MMPLIERLIGVLRPYQIRGKGFAFNNFIPTSGSRTVKVWGKSTMTLNMSNVQHRQVFMGCLGRQIAQWIRTLLPEGGTFLDVGANIGYFTILASNCVGPSGKVFAIEPNPQTFTLLQGHLSANGLANTHASMIALGDTTAPMRLYVPPASENRDYNVSCMPEPGWNALDVPCQRLDDYLRDRGIGAVDLMKIDVEGAEPFVFRGGSAALAAGAVRCLISEFNGYRLSKGNSGPKQLLEQLQDMSFLPAKVRHRRVIPIRASSLDLDPRHEFDHLFVHKTAL